MVDARRVLDTSVLVDVLRDREDAIEWVDSLDTSERAISAITGFELLAGCRDLREQHQTDRELSRYDVLWPDEAICRHALELYRRHHLGDGIGFLHCLIATTAVASRRRVATRNLRHFRLLAGVDAATPYGSSPSPTV